MKRILILGAASFTGYKFYNLFKEYYDICGTFNNEPEFNNKEKFIKLDIANINDVYLLISKLKPDILINFISLGNVDECEKNKDLAKQLNYEFVKRIVDFVTQLKMKFINFSSNAVYDGENPPYSEKSIKMPINYYGKTKKLSDEYMMNNSMDYMVLRPITMIGLNEEFQRKNPFTFIYNNIIENKNLDLVSDVYVNFLYVNDLCKSISKLIDIDFKGEINISGDDKLSWYDLGVLIKRQVCYSSSIINKVSINDFKTLAPRPKDTSMDNSKCKKTIGLKPTPIQDAIVEMIDHINR